MRIKDAEDLSRFIKELNRETDRGLPLVCAALIDAKLGETLTSFFCTEKSANKLLNESNAPLATFSARIETCFALGLIDQFEYQEIHLIRKIRNEFAHEKHGISFNTIKVASFCSSLKTPLPEDATYSITEARWKFINAAVALVLRLYYRPEYVAMEKRKPKTWVDSEAVRWRKIEDEQPPAGMPVILLGK